MSSSKLLIQLVSALTLVSRPRPQSRIVKLSWRNEMAWSPLSLDRFPFKINPMIENMHSTATDEVLLTTVFVTGFKCSNCTWVFQNTPVKFKAPPPHETWLTWTGGGGGLVAAAPVTTSRVWACQWEMANSDALHNRNWLPSEVYARKRLPLLNVGLKTAYTVSNLLLLLFNYYVIIIIYYFFFWLFYFNFVY